MANKYFINELGVEVTYLELRIFSYLECEEKIKKITEILKNERLNHVGSIPKDVEKYNMEDYNASEANSSYKGGKKEDWKGEDDEDDEE